MHVASMMGDGKASQRPFQAEWFDTLMPCHKFVLDVSMRITESRSTWTEFGISICLRIGATMGNQSS